MQGDLRTSANKGRPCDASGLLDRAIALAVRMCKRLGAVGIWLMLGVIGLVSCFLNSTPIVVLGAPVVRDVATMKLPPKCYLMPLSYIIVLTGCCTLVGTSTKLLVADMARVAEQPRFGMFEITPVGLPIAIAIAGGLYLFLFSGRLIGRGSTRHVALPAEVDLQASAAQVGDATLFAEPRPFHPTKFEGRSCVGSARMWSG